MGSGKCPYVPLLLAGVIFFWMVEEDSDIDTFHDFGTLDAGSREILKEVNLTTQPSASKPHRYVSACGAFRNAGASSTMNGGVSTEAAVNASNISQTDGRNVRIHSYRITGTGAWCHAVLEGELNCREVSGKLGFLFLVNDRLTFAELWAKYFTKSETSEWEAVIHYSSLDVTVEKAPKLGFRHNVLPHTPSAWAASTLVMTRGYKTLLRDEDVFGCILLSDSHVPVHTLSKARQLLGSTDHSVFGRRSGWSRSQAEEEIKKRPIWKAETWTYLRRSDMLAFIQEHERLVVEQEGVPLPTIFQPLIRKWLDAVRNGVPSAIEETYPINVVRTKGAAAENRSVPLEVSAKTSFVSWRMEWNHFEPSEAEEDFSRNHPMLFKRIRLATFKQMRQCSLFARKMNLDTTVEGMRVDAFLKHVLFSSAAQGL
eukprot:jgi/Bigna1/89445/estExt_fgenesh1_pg.C_490094